MGTREYIGAGGLRLHLDEPLSDEMAKQVASGHLQPAIGQADTDAQDAAPTEDTPPDGGAGVGVERPAKTAPVAEWRTYAAARGMDGATDATKAECQDYVQVLDEAGE